MAEHRISRRLPELVSQAVVHYWRTRQAQQEKQVKGGRGDQGARSAVTGGAQMNGFIQLFSRLTIEAGVQEDYIFYKKALELPGFFRPTKEWDLLIVRNEKLVLALEAKSQVGPSFGNNFNNRTEEAMGSALDLWTAFREGAFNGGTQPFVGYFFMLEDCPGSQAPVKVSEPHFKVFPEFKNVLMPKDTSCFAANWFWRGITLHSRLLHLKEKRIRMVFTVSPHPT
jgi:hypothetical protein